MPDKPTEDTPGREVERYNETMGDEPLDEKELDPEEAKRRITQFIASAEELPGPPVEQLAEQVSVLMRAALRDLEAIMDGKPQNKVLATQLLMGQRALAMQPEDPERWRLSAASTLLSEIVIRGAKSRRRYKIAHLYPTPQYVVLTRMHRERGKGVKPGPMDTLYSGSCKRGSQNNPSTHFGE